MRCTECGSTMQRTVGDHVYRESGMEHVVLRNIATCACPEDGRVVVQIPAIGRLHRALALALAGKPARLVPSEVRFLRDYLDLSNTQFAGMMGVSPTQSSRWTTSEPIGPQAERFLRMLAVLGPERVKPTHEEHLPPDETPTTSAAEETLDEMSKVIKQLPSLSPEVKSMKIGLRRNSDGWKQEAALEPLQGRRRA